MKGECKTCHRPPDFTNVGACPNCGRFDWVLVSQGSTATLTLTTPFEGNRFLWACPCSDFKWTSYVGWEARQASTFEGNTFSGSGGISVEELNR